MAGTIVADTLEDGGGEQQSVDRLIHGIGYAWVNFNGTGTVAIRDSYNVTSLTDNGTGDYTVNLTSALPNANYSALTACGVFAANTDKPNVGNLTTSSFDIFTKSGATAADVDVITAVAFCNP